MTDYTVETRLFGEVPVKNDQQSTENHQINNQKFIINMNNSTKNDDVAVIDISEEGNKIRIMLLFVSTMGI